MTAHRYLTEGGPARWVAFSYFFLFLVYSADAAQFVIDGAVSAAGGGAVGGLRFFPVLIVMPVIVLGQPWHHCTASGALFTVCLYLSYRFGLFPAISISPDDWATLCAYIAFGCVVSYYYEARIRQAWMLTRRLRLAKEAADAGVRAKSLFLSNTNHELRTPLHGIIGMTDLLIETRLEPQQLEYLQTVRRCSESLMAMVCDILDLEKAEAGLLELERRPFALRDALEAVTDIVFVAAQRGNVDLACVVEGPLAEAVVVGDVTRFKQVLLNLASNAVKFSSRQLGQSGAEGSGHVLVRAERAAAPAGDPRFWLRVAVEDDGIGIPPESMGQLFRPFSQLDATHTRKYGGTGLGLALVKSFVGRMGGTISVTSTPGEGATFAVCLPFGEAPPEPALDSLPDPALPAAAIRVRSWRTSTRRALAAALDAQRCALADGPEEGALLVTDDPREAAAARAARPPRPVVELVTPGADGGSALDAPGRVLLPLKLKSLRRALTSAIAAAASSDAPPPPPAVVCSPSTAPLSPLRADPSRNRALIAEDNDVNARVLSRMLARLGFELEVVENGQAAVDACLSGRFDLLVTDVSMPVKSGYEAAAEIRALQAAGRVPPALVVVGCSANATREDRERGLAAGMRAYLSKPCRMPQIEAALEEAGLLEACSQPPPLEPATIRRLSETAVDKGRLSPAGGDCPPPLLRRRRNSDCTCLAAPAASWPAASPSSSAATPSV